MPSQVVTYQLDDATQVQFEIELTPGYQPAGGPEEIIGRVRAAIGPAVDAARVVLEQARRAAPEEIQVKFGIKVTGTMNWLVAKAATEGNFEVALTWRHGSNPAGGPAEGGTAEGGTGKGGTAEGGQAVPDPRR
ncbi:CU044_2847 family protein [Nonomuraea antri]|uniref:CU044_2847 family protein n=1 Tax=Nonomuraea antri TaxID=2730852 RepID=UPI001C2C35BF|nr:CU044_2847 family protein [Nonomuraea antri]